jgi:Outer membrane protein beta-barrel domain
VCSVVLFATVFATFAGAQQFNIAAGASITLASTYNGSSQVFRPPAENEGTYPHVSLAVLLHKHLGVNGEVAIRQDQGIYNGFQKFRPILYDFNAVYATHLARNTNVDFMAGVGGESVRFDAPVGNCTYAAGCPIHISDNHFLVHVGADLRYYLWRSIFVSPEIHYYRILNNTVDFNSDNLFRAGASVGYSFGSR